MTITFPNPEHTRTYLLGRKRLLVPCRRCKAGVGWDCTSGRYQNSAVRHKVRFDDADALGLPDDEVVARLTAILRPGSAAAREACQRQIDDITADPRIRDAQAVTRTAALVASAKAGAQFRLRLVSERDNRPPLGPTRGGKVTDLDAERLRRRGAGPGAA